MNLMRRALMISLAACLGGCGSSTATDAPRSEPTVARSSTPSAPRSSPPSAAPTPTRIVHVGTPPVVTGEPIDLADLSGRILFDDFEDVFAMNVDGSDVVTVAGAPGAEFD